VLKWSRMIRHPQLWQPCAAQLIGMTSLSPGRHRHLCNILTSYALPIPALHIRDSHCLRQLALS
jgi:hypothetical protein